jgi:hypothetical protein
MTSATGWNSGMKKDDSHASFQRKTAKANQNTLEKVDNTGSYSMLSPG